METEYKGKRVFFEDRGEGDVIIFLHGWGCDHSIFDAITDRMKDQYRVVALDFPGFGESEEPDSVWGVEEYTEFFEAFCKGRGFDCPSLVAHSFGGRVAILFASRNDVRKMVLTDAAGIKPRRSL